MDTHKKYLAEVLLMSTYRFWWRYKKTTKWITPLIWSYDSNKMALNRSPESYVVSKSAQIDLKKLDPVS